MIESFFVVVKKNGLVRRVWEEKRINSNNIHLRASFPQNGHHQPRSASLHASSCAGWNPSPVSAVPGHERTGSCLPTPVDLLEGPDPQTRASGNGIKLQIALKYNLRLQINILNIVIKGVKLYLVLFRLYAHIWCSKNFERPTFTQTDTQMTNL